MSDPLFSVIIPTHNAAEFIRKGLDSIKAQTFTDYELIIVCDNCTDATSDIAREYTDKILMRSYGRDGLSRDAGIDAAAGRYILFMDDDDWFMHEYAFQLIADAIAAKDPDMVAFGYIFRTKGYKAPFGDELFTPRIAHVWSKAWRRERVLGAHFGAAVFSSDTYFLRDMRPRIGSYATIDQPLYYYNFKRPGSQTDLFCRGIIRQSPVAE